MVMKGGSLKPNPTPVKVKVRDRNKDWEIGLYAGDLDLFVSNAQLHLIALKI